MRILVTGGAGFIGSAVVRHLIANTPHSVVNIDKLTYAASLDSLKSVSNNPRYAFEHADICDAEKLTRIFEKHRPGAVMHLAAESHVDRSIEGPDAFILTNIVGTFRLLTAVLAYYRSLPDADKAAFRFHHVSTDEVFGSLAQGDAAFCETTPYDPRSPYSASKASSDHLVRAWGHTYGLPVVLTNCTNNYGPFHFPEKLIPASILKAMQGAPVPVYGDGNNIRDWLYVDDHAEALVAVITKGRVDETYGIGGEAEITNLEVVTAICDCLDDMVGVLPGGRPRSSLITFVSDRPGHDFRYAMSIQKIKRELGWQPRESFHSGLRKTVRWYLDNRDWWEPLAQRYDGRRIGAIEREAKTS